MTIGALEYVPSGRFAFARSGHVSLSIAQGDYLAYQDSANVFKLDIVGYTPHHVYTFVIAPNFMPWSTIGFTLDYLLREAYYVYDGDPTHYPAPVKISWEWWPGSPNASIHLAPFAVGWSPAIFTLPPAPAGWWSR